jgi:hypothetical protein
MFSGTLDPDFRPGSSLSLLDKKTGFVTGPLSWYPVGFLSAVRAFIWLAAFSRDANFRQRSEQYLCWRDLRLTFRPQAAQVTASRRFIFSLSTVEVVVNFLIAKVLLPGARANAGFFFPGSGYQKFLG